MARDWAQYAVISVAALYGFWAATRAREETAGRWAAPAAAAVGSALCGLTFTAATGGIPLAWLTASEYAPAYGGSALLADTALWTLTALCGCLAVRVLRRRIHRETTVASRMAAGPRASS
jgi:hypothetical protein